MASESNHHIVGPENGYVTVFPEAPLVDDDNYNEGPMWYSGYVIFD